MAQNIEQLLLQVEASTALMRTELQRGEQSLASLENRTQQTERRMATSFQRIDRAAGNSRIGFQQLGFQLQDVAAQAATGTSALTIFAQQGGQVAFALSQFGGVVGRVGNFLSGPWGVALAAGAVALGVLSKASGDAENAGKTLGEAYGDAGLEIEKASANILSAVSRLGANLSPILKRIKEETISDIGLIAKAYNFLAQQVQGRLAPIVPPLEVVPPRNRSPEEILAGNNPAVAVFGEDLFRRITAKPEKAARTPKAKARALTAREKFDEADAVASSFQEVAGRLTRESGQPLSAIKADLEGLRTDAERVGDAFAKRFEAAERFSENIANNLAQGIVFGQNIGTALVNSFKAAAAEALASGLFAIFRSLGQGSNLSTAFQAGFAAFGGARANGGPVSGGRTYLVGERGPELFTPRAAGAIIPNGAFGGGASEIIVRTEPSPLFVTSVVQAGQAGGAAAAGQVVRQATRGRIMSSRGA